jgi:hypothetical protein
MGRFDCICPVLISLVPDTRAAALYRQGQTIQELNLPGMVDPGKPPLWIPKKRITSLRYTLKVYKSYLQEASCKHLLRSKLLQRLVQIILQIV